MSLFRSRGEHSGPPARAQVARPARAAAPRAGVTYFLDTNSTSQVTCINSWRAVLWRWRADAWLTGLALDRACHGFVCSLEAPHSGAWRAPALPPLVCVVLHLARRFAKMLACTPSPTSKLMAEDKVQVDVLDTRTTPSTKSFARRSSSTSRSSATSPSTTCSTVVFQTRPASRSSSTCTNRRPP